MTNCLFCAVILASAYLIDAQRWTPIQSVQEQHRRQQQQQQQQQKNQGPSEQIGQCVDTAVNCLENSYFCTQPYYIPVMRQQCARTCGFCKSSEPTFDSLTCRDINPECRNWSQNGFCESLFYPEEVKHRYCAFSCKYCQPSPLPDPQTETTTSENERQTTPNDDELKDEEKRQEQKQSGEGRKEEHRETIIRTHRVRASSTPPTMRTRTNEPIDESILFRSSTPRDATLAREQDMDRSTTTTERPEKFEDVE